MHVKRAFSETPDGKGFRKGWINWERCPRCDADPREQSVRGQLLLTVISLQYVCSWDLKAPSVNEQITDIVTQLSVRSCSNSLVPSVCFTQETASRITVETVSDRNVPVLPLDGVVIWKLKPPEIFTVNQ